MLLAERHESERLRQIIKELQRHRFGRKAESLPEEKMLLGLEESNRLRPVRKPAKTRQLRKAGRSAHASAVTIAEHYRRICRRSRSWSTSTPRPPPAARATCTRSAKTKASGWTWCGTVPRCHSTSQICLPSLRDGVLQAESPGPVDRGRTADGGNRRPASGVCRSSCVLEHTNERRCGSCGRDEGSPLGADDQA